MLDTGNQLLVANPEYHVEIWLVILLLSTEKCHAKQMFVLSSSMKLGPGLVVWGLLVCRVELNNIVP